MRQSKVMPRRPHVEEDERSRNTDSIKSNTNEHTDSCRRGKSIARTHQTSCYHKGSRVRLARVTVAISKATSMVVT